MVLPKKLYTEAKRIVIGIGIVGQQAGTEDVKLTVRCIRIRSGDRGLVDDVHGDKSIGAGAVIVTHRISETVTAGEAIVGAIVRIVPLALR
jgi:hypothetical protein